MAPNSSAPFWPESTSSSATHPRKAATQGGSIKVAETWLASEESFLMAVWENCHGTALFIVGPKAPARQLVQSYLH